MCLSESWLNGMLRSCTAQLCGPLRAFVCLSFLDLVFVVFFSCGLDFFFVCCVVFSVCLGCLFVCFGFFWVGPGM